MATAQVRALAAEVHRARREARFEDYRELVANGVIPPEAAKRVGSNAVALARQAFRHKAPDIARPLNAWVLMERRTR